MDRGLVYVVHSDPAIAGHVGEALVRSSFKTVTMSTPEQAEGVLSGHQFVLPDAILTPLGDLESGDSILIRLLNSNPLMEQIPLVVLATRDEDQRRRALRLGLLSVIQPPYDPEEVALTTQLAIEKYRSEQLLFGSLSQLSVPDLLQTAEVGRRSGVISFQHDQYKGRVWLRDGVVVNAEIEGVCEAEEAVYLIALWQTGTFEANFQRVEVEERIHVQPSALLLEAMRRFDEGLLPTMEEVSAPKRVQQQGTRVAVADLSLVLLNLSSAYALNHLEATLLESRLERLRQEARAAHPVLDAFHVADGGLVRLARPPEDGDPKEWVAGVSSWVVALFERLESALAWRFPIRRLGRIAAPWRAELEAAGFVAALGLDGEDADGDDEGVMRAGPMHEAVIPCGCFLLDEGGRIDRYSPFGSQATPRESAAYGGQAILAVLPPRMGDVARSQLRTLTQEGDGGAGSTLSEVTLALGHRRVIVRLGLVRTASPDRFLLTVNRVRGNDLELLPGLERDVARGTVSDGVRRVLAASDDFFAAFNALFGRGHSFRQHELLHRFGKQWGLRHVLRIERLVQRNFGLTLREVEAQMAIEALSASLGVLGLGHFDLDLSHRPAGVLVVVHHASPFPTYGSAPGGGACSILAGFYAALLSYLSGRQLAAREVSCSSSPERPCRFVVATEERLTKLMVARPGSSDHELLARIGAESALLTTPRHQAHEQAD